MRYLTCYPKWFGTTGDRPTRRGGWLFSNVGAQSRVSRTAMACSYVRYAAAARCLRDTGDYGNRRLLSILKQDQKPDSEPVFDAGDARAVIAMMEQVAKIAFRDEC